MPRWTPESRAKQAELIQQTKPWLNSTGPATAAGKRRASQNASKGRGHDELNRVLRQVDAVLRRTAKTK